MNKISLAKFDPDFLTTIKDYKKIHLDPKDGTFCTILLDSKPVGVIGFIGKGDFAFLKIGIHQNFRGQGIFGLALDLLVKKHHLKTVFSTIALANIASIKSHQKLGFTRISPEEETKLRQSGFLLKRNIRMFKHF